MKYNGIIQKKLARLSREHEFLSLFLADFDRDKFVASWSGRSATERSLQIMVETIIDIADRIISLEKAGPVDSSVEAIEKLVSLGVLATAEPYIEMVRFRNLLVHVYDDIDPGIVYAIATEKLADFIAFKNIIENS